MTYANPQTADQQSGVANQGLNPSGPVSQAPSAGFVAGGVGGAQATQLSDYKIIRRNGSVVAFEPSKIAIAVTKAFLAVNGGQGAASARVRGQGHAHALGVVGAAAVGGVGVAAEWEAGSRRLFGSRGQPAPGVPSTSPARPSPARHAHVSCSSASSSRSRIKARTLAMPACAWADRARQAASSAADDAASAPVAACASSNAACTSAARRASSSWGVGA